MKSKPKKFDPYAVSYLLCGSVHHSTFVCVAMLQNQDYTVYFIGLGVLAVVVIGAYLALARPAAAPKKSN